MKTTLLSIDLLKPHEEHIEEHVETVMSWLENDKKLLTPLHVDNETYVILEGHHRYRAMQRLGYSKVPVFLISYLNNNGIEVMSLRKEITVTKEKVIDTAVKGNLLPCKTSRHLIAPGLLEWPVSLQECL